METQKSLLRSAWGLGKSSPTRQIAWHRCHTGRACVAQHLFPLDPSWVACHSSRGGCFPEDLSASFTPSRMKTAQRRAVVSGSVTARFLKERNRVCSFFHAAP